MNFGTILLVCLGGIVGCATLVFAVETLVAFCFHEQEQPASSPLASAAVVFPGPVLLDRPPLETAAERAA